MSTRGDINSLHKELRGQKNNNKGNAENDKINPLLKAIKNSSDATTKTMESLIASSDRNAVADREATTSASTNMMTGFGEAMKSMANGFQSTNVVMMQMMQQQQQLQQQLQQQFMQQQQQQQRSTEMAFMMSILTGRTQNINGANNAINTGNGGNNINTPAQVPAAVPAVVPTPAADNTAPASVNVATGQQDNNEVVIIGETTAGARGRGEDPHEIREVVQLDEEVVVTMPI